MHLKNHSSSSQKQTNKSHILTIFRFELATILTTVNQVGLNDFQGIQTSTFDSKYFQN